jgi:hypothetical protein
MFQNLNIRRRPENALQRIDHKGNDMTPFDALFQNLNIRRRPENALQRIDHKGNDMPPFDAFPPFDTSKKQLILTNEHAATLTPANGIMNLTCEH